MDNAMLGSVFDELKNLDSREKSILASFDRRIGMLYEHKNKIRSLVLALCRIKSRWVNPDDKKQIISLAEGVSSLLQKSFISFEMNLKETIGLVGLISEEEKKIIREDIEKNKALYNDFLKLKDKDFPKMILEKLYKELLIEGRSEKLHEEFNERLNFLKMGILEQEKFVKRELSILGEMHKIFSSEFSYDERKIKGWCTDLNYYSKEIEMSLKKEKDNIHEPLDMLIKDTHRARMMSKRIFNEHLDRSFLGRFSDNLLNVFGIDKESDKIMMAIKNDVETFSSSEEYGLYIDKLNELTLRIPLSGKVRVFLHKLDVERTKADKEKTLSMRGLSVLASTDALTGLPNRRALELALLKEISRSIRHTHPISVLMLDIDHFKSYNDSFGHDAGDAVLKSFAKIITGKNKRDEDISGRQGGEEFMIILPETDSAAAYNVAERIRTNVMSQSRAIMKKIKETFRQTKGNPSDFYDFKVSIGCTTYKPKVVDDIEKIAERLKRDSDLALYEAKKTRNCVKSKI